MEGAERTHCVSAGDAGGANHAITDSSAGKFAVPLDDSRIETTGLQCPQPECPGSAGVDCSDGLDASRS